MDSYHQNIITGLNTALSRIEIALDLPKLQQKIETLEIQVSDPGLWNNQVWAQKVTSDLSHAYTEIKQIQQLRKSIDELTILLTIAIEDNDFNALKEIYSEIRKVKKNIQKLEIQTLLSGNYDEREAIITIRSGAGGIDAADWAEMLMRMYTRWSEKHNYSIEVVNISYSEEAGIKSATFIVRTQFAYGILSSEQGTHRLVRISPFDNQNRRQTSFADVEVLPVVKTTDQVAIPEKDIRIDVYRSSGPGGQSVNTTDSAVRLTHIPTGVIVICQNQKSQLQNKTSAMRVLQAKILELKHKEERAEINSLKKESSNSWGSQIRSYILHPYQTVKDVRTEYESGNPLDVLNGDIDNLLESGIRWRNKLKCNFN